MDESDGAGVAVGCALLEGVADGGRTVGAADGGGVGAGDGGPDAVGCTEADGEGDTGPPVAVGEGCGVGAAVGSGVGAGVLVGVDVGGRVEVGATVGVRVGVGTGVGEAEVAVRFSSTVVPSRHVAVWAARAPPIVNVTVAPSAPQPVCAEAARTSMAYAPPAFTCVVPHVALPIVATTRAPLIAGCPLSCAVPETRIGAV